MKSITLNLICVLLLVIFASLVSSTMFVPDTIHVNGIFPMEGLVSMKGNLKSDLMISINDYPTNPNLGIQDLQLIQQKLDSDMYPSVQGNIKTQLASYLPNMISAGEQLAKNNVSPLQIQTTFSKIVNST